MFCAVAYMYAKDRGCVDFGFGCEAFIDNYLKFLGVS